MSHGLKSALEKHRSSRPEVFCKRGVVAKFCKIHRETPVPESLIK